MEVYSITDKGETRKSNEDNYFSIDSKIGPVPNIFFVADGMGGENAGQYASERATECILKYLKETDNKEPVKAIKEAINYANSVIYRESKEDEAKKGMGTTLVLATVLENQIIVANVGDSRLYLCEAGHLKQVTVDHSFVNELVRLGKVSKEEAKNHPTKNKITRAVGAEEKIQADFFDIDLKKDDILLLCSDGLTNMVSDDCIEQILNENISLCERAQKLVDKANENGGIDNITVILVKL